MTRPAVPPSIFRAYDIRGVVGQTLTADIAHRIGLGIGSEARDRGEQALIIGRDGRHSSPELAGGPGCGPAREWAGCRGYRYGSYAAIVFCHPLAAGEQWSDGDGQP